MKRILAHLVPLTIIAVSIFPGVAHGQDSLACESLAELKIDNVNLLSATRVAGTTDLPPHCRVLGYVRPAINFDIRLPAQNWNGKFYMAGCGGFCGTLDSDHGGFTNAMNYGLRRNYAVSTMDSGHWVFQCSTDAGLTTIVLPRSIGAAAPLPRRRKSRRQ